ncbi:pathogenesis-related protein [Artemisia annua]|uniref:Pathogenesis-related protein n=1 Tax=Artemisia annua TaxID=35608 RepID=A0A2U1KWF3_ARTAN|nr:pathogenesis-related protein [Artemisia annua]
MAYYVKNSLISFTILTIFCFTFTQGANFDVINRCPYTVWAAAAPGGGRRLETGQSWSLAVPTGTAGRIWGRTNCNFDANGQGKCETGDCNGRLECQGYGTPPITMAEFSLNPNKNLDLDHLDISLVDGFNIPMEFSPVDASCKTLRCAVDLNNRCPLQLRTKGGCNSPCTVFKTDEYCCTGESNVPDRCGPTDYSKFFKSNCPDAYSYANDETNLTASCPAEEEKRKRDEYFLELTASDSFKDVHHLDSNGGKGNDLLIFSFASIMAATNDFSDENKLGQGGFGPVYKAWELWQQGNALELEDTTLRNTCVVQQFLRTVHVALLCVQESATDRPTTSDMISMLLNDSVPLPAPSKPAFLISKVESESTSEENKPKHDSINNMTISAMAGR